jgi:hypothetical protein
LSHLQIDCLTRRAGVTQVQRDIVSRGAEAYAAYRSTKATPILALDFADMDVDRSWCRRRG